MREPSLTGKKDRPFTLKGDLIDLYSKNRKVERVIARANAVATSDSMTLRSDTIDLRVKNDLLDHAYVWGKKSRARAVSPSQNLLADSLDVTMPGQKVRLMRALGNAYAQGKPDTARFLVEKPDTTDWLKGDTITAHFDTTATKDTSKTPNIRQLLALGHAASWYHLPASDSAERRPAINDVSAKRITIDFGKQAGKQQVATVTAVDSVVGVYVEPRADTTTKRTNANAAGKGPAKTSPTVPPKTPPKTPAKPPAKTPASEPLPSLTTRQL
jgi:lipopolysaccharide export system protein LptA